MQTAHVAGAVIVGEDVEQRAVDDRVVGVLPERQCVGDLEPGGYAPRLNGLPGLLDRGRRPVDAEHVVSRGGQQQGVLAGTAADVEDPAGDEPGAFQFDHRRLRFADHQGGFSFSLL